YCDEVLSDFYDVMHHAGRPSMSLDGEVAWVLQTLAALRFIVADNKPCAPQPRHHRFGNTRIGIPQNADFPGALPAFEHRREAVNGIYDRRLAQLRQPLDLLVDGSVIQPAQMRRPRLFLCVGDRESTRLNASHVARADA